MLALRVLESRLVKRIEREDGDMFLLADYELLAVLSIFRREGQNSEPRSRPLHACNAIPLVESLSIYDNLWKFSIFPQMSSHRALCRTSITSFR